MPDLGRTRQSFPSRQYRYNFTIPTDVLADEPAAGDSRVQRFILGRDALPVPISRAEGPDLLRDPFARLVLFGDAPPPMTIRELLARLDAVGVTGHRTFVVADGGQIPWSPATDDLARNFRLAIARQKPEDAQPDILISASTDLDSPTEFLQVIGWDESAGGFRFYERRDGMWTAAGSSWDALEPGSRGEGPFDSHVNGALNMKELKFPWVHWHSPSAAISDAVLAPDDPLRREPVWTNRSLADDFERTVVRPAIGRWTDSRIKGWTNGTVVTRVPELLRQILGTSTVNLVSSATSSAALGGGADVKLPITFLLDADSLLGTIGLAPIAAPVVPAAVYREALARFNVRIGDGRHEFPGDTHFVFVVPEPAFEDVLVLEKLIELDILSDRLAAALLMVDFVNPVFSFRRASLANYAPAEARIGDPDGFAAALVNAVESAPPAQFDGRPEQEFLANWSLPEGAWRAEYDRRIAAFANAASAQCATAVGFAPIFALAESRRREFRRRPLAEFRLTTPITNIPDDAPPLELDPSGTVRPKNEAHMALTRFDAPGFLNDWNEQAAGRWSDWISRRFDDVRARDGADDGVANFGPRLQFFNPLRTPPAADAVTKDIDWPAFPRVVQLNSVTDRQRWRTADSSRDQQDEYCEWSVTRNSADKVVRVTFTSEGPEYWEFLAAVAPNRVLELYRQHISPEVTHSDIFDQGQYVQRNRWNNSTTTGAMHLIQGSNTLGAEIELAAAATLVRLKNGQPITEAQELIACGRYGEPQRHSDPFIGAQVNELARLKADITLANPVGLYIAGLSVAGWVTPDGSNPADYWKVTRGTKEKALRAVYEVPGDRDFVVGDIKIGGRAIEFGAQIADFIRIKLTGLATRIGRSTVAPMNGCVETAQQDEPGITELPPPPPVEDVLSGQRTRGFKRSR